MVILLLREITWKTKQATLGKHPPPPTEKVMFLRLLLVGHLLPANTDVTVASNNNNNCTIALH